MNNQEYEQKKRECWEEFLQKHEISRANGVTADAFIMAFDRAYALGKEKETITQEEIEEAAEDYVSFEKGGKCYPSYIVERACCCAFKDGANFALGKQKKNSEDTVIRGWMSRDKDGDLFIYTCKPERCSYLGYWDENVVDITPSNDLFPDLTWDSEPEQVEIVIKRTKK